MERNRFIVVAASTPKLSNFWHLRHPKVSHSRVTFRWTDVDTAGPTAASNMFQRWPWGAEVRALIDGLGALALPLFLGKNKEVTHATVLLKPRLPAGAEQDLVNAQP